MGIETLTESFQKPGFWKAAITSGLIIAALDATAACTNAYLANGVSPERVWIYVSSGVFGKASFTGGSSMIVWGLLFHVIIAMSWTFLFFFIAPMIKVKNDLVVGAAYGIFIWLMMNFVVVPLSNVPPSTFKLKGAIIMILIHIFVIGIPISLLTSRFFSRN